MDQKQMINLVERSRSGDRMAQEDLISAVQNYVYYHCCKLVQNRESAMDATQEVLIAMLTGLPNLQEPAAFRSWLLQIIYRRCSNQRSRGMREYKMEKALEEDDSLDNWADDDVSTIPDQALDNAETVRILRELVEELTQEQRICVLLYYYDELKISEIAAILSLPETTVKSRLYRARKTLKDGILQYEHRNGKLYTLSMEPLLLYLFHSEAQEERLSMSAGAALADTAISATSHTAIATATAVGTVVKIVAGITALGMIAGGLWMMRDLRKTKPPELPEQSNIGEVQLLETLRAVTEAPSDDLMTQFYLYYRSPGHWYELSMMPDFDATHAPDWDALTLYGYLNGERAEDATMTQEGFADTIRRYFPEVQYEDHSSAYLTYADGVYTPVPGDTMWTEYFRLTELSVDTSGVFTAQFDVLMFDELEYSEDYESLRPNMKYLRDTAGATSYTDMGGDVLMETILQVFQEEDYSEHLSMTETVEIRFQLSDDTAYPLVYLSHSHTLCAQEGEAVPPW